MPKLYKVDLRGKTRVWFIKVVLILKKNIIREEQPTMEIAIENLSLYSPFKHEVGLMTVHGIKGSLNLIINGQYIFVGHQGRNPLEQGIFMMNSKYNAKMKQSNYKPLSEFKKNTSAVNDLSPMLAKNYRTLYVDKNKELNFDDKWYYVQPKFDGERAMIFIKNGEIHIRGRRGIDFENLHHLNEIISKMNLIDNDDFLDGELMVSGKSFQNINSITHSHDSSLTKMVNFMAFDMYKSSADKMSFENRYQLLSEIVSTQPIVRNGGKIMMVDTSIVHNTKELTDKHHKFVDAGFEGIIIRDPESRYIFGRSSGLLKWKFQEEDDYEIVDAIAASTGRETNAIIWRCITSNGYEFNVRPRGTIKNRRKMYKDVRKNINNYVGKILQVYHEGFSDAGIPRNPRSSLFPKVQ